LKNHNLELELTEGMLYRLVARVYVKASISNEGETRRYITQDCISTSEFNYHIDRLVSELESIRMRGLEKLSAKE